MDTLQEGYKILKFGKKAHKCAQESFNRKRTVILSEEFNEWWLCHEKEYKSKCKGVKHFLDSIGKKLQDFPETQKKWFLE